MAEDWEIDDACSDGDRAGVVESIFKTGAFTHRLHVRWSDGSTSLEDPSRLIWIEAPKGET